jgi:hypothetical protein
VDGQVNFSHQSSIMIIIPFLIAWTTAAIANSRVIGAMPIVLDMVHLQQVKEYIHFKITHIFFYSI